MPKVKISEYSATANSNTDVASINIDEGCAPSGINNAIRAIMGHLKDFQQGTNGDPFNGPHNGTVGATTANTGAFTTLTTTGAVTVNGGAASTAIAIPNGASNPVNAYGATTASTLFAIANTGGTSYFGNEGSTAGVSFTGTSAYATVVGTSAARQLQFVTNSAVQATINSTGLFGLGVLPTGTTKFQVVSAGNNVASFQDSSAQGIKYVVATDGAGQIKHLATWEASGVNAYHAWYVTNSVGTQPQAMTLNVNGALALLGASTSATGVGITFPATQSASSDANTLDDYEEGTFTPTIVGSTTAGTGTYSTQLGKYTKIGNVVNFKLYVLWSAHTGTGNMLISGLPFTSPSDAFDSSVSVGFLFTLSLSASNVITALVGVNANQITLLQYPTGGGTSAAVPIDADAGIEVAGMYFV